METNVFGQIEQQQPEPKKTNKTVIILLVLIIISAIALGVLLANQQGDTANSNKYRTADSRYTKY